MTKQFIRSLSARRYYGIETNGCNYHITLSSHDDKRRKVILTLRFDTPRKASSAMVIDRMWSNESTRAKSCLHLFATCSSSEVIRATGSAAGQSYILK
jgi:hypothetical protein